MVGESHLCVCSKSTSGFTSPLGGRYRDAPRAPTLHLGGAVTVLTPEDRPESCLQPGAWGGGKEERMRKETKEGREM